MADAKPLFTLALHEDGLYVGDVLLSRPQFDSATHRFITFMLLHPNELLKFSDVVTAAELPKNSRRLPHYINELGFVGRMKSVYFPISTGGYIKLRNPIAQEDLERYFPDGDIPVAVGGRDMFDDNHNKRKKM